MKLIASLRSKTHDAAAFAWKHHPDANQVLAVATIILVVLAYMALKDTEDTLELSERAWVGPADAKIDAVPQEGKVMWLVELSSKLDLAQCCRWSPP